MVAVKLFRYYLRLLPLGVQQVCQLTLTDVAECLITSKRHARTLLKQMQDLGWLSWQPSVGRNQRSLLTLHHEAAEIRQLLAMKLVELGGYDKALEMLNGDQQWFGRLLQETSGASHRSGELHLQLTYNRPFAALLPHEPLRNSEKFFLRQVYSALVRCDNDGGISADLAHHWWHDDQGLRWRFYLRPGLTFHNGDTIDAACLSELFTCLRQHPDYRVELEHLESVSAIQPLCLEFVLKQPDYGFAGLLADPRYVVQHPRQLAGAATRLVAGSGPFQVVLHTPERLQLQAFGQYYGTRALPETVTIWHIDSYEKVEPSMAQELPQAASNSQKPFKSSCQYQLGNSMQEHGTADKHQVQSMQVEKLTSRNGPEQSRLEYGCQYLLFNQRVAGTPLSIAQRRYLADRLSPDALLAIMGSSEEELGIKVATNVLPYWTPIARSPVAAVDLPERLDLAVYDLRELKVHAQAIANALSKLNVECRISVYAFDRLQARIQSGQLTESLILTSNNLGDSWSASAFRWLYADPLLHSAIAEEGSDWLRARLRNIRQSSRLAEYLDELEPLAMTMVTEQWLCPLFHYQQILRFQDVLKGVAMTEWGWPDIREVWVAD